MLTTTLYDRCCVNSTPISQRGSEELSPLPKIPQQVSGPVGEAAELMRASTLWAVALHHGKDSPPSCAEVSPVLSRGRLGEKVD